MQGTAYYNGEIAPLSDVKIPLSDRSVFFGDAVYDAAIGRSGGLYLEEEHLERFFRSAALAGITLKYTADELSHIIHATVSASELTEYFVYLQLSARGEARTHKRPPLYTSNLLVTVTPYSLPPEEKSLSLILFPDKRYGYCNLKTTNLLPAVLASDKAARDGADEAVFVKGSKVTECAHSNIFILKNRRLFTHPEGDEILSGISRRRLISIGERLGIETAEIPFEKEALFSADEILITSTTKLCLRASFIDGTPVGGGDKSTAERLISEVRYDYFRATARNF